MNAAQLAVLDSFIGSNGIYILEILESELIDKGTKIIYLQRALTCDCFTFNEWISKLIPLTNMTKWRTLAEAFKFINDIYNNNEVTYDEYGVYRAHGHYFKNLGDIDINALQSAVRSHIDQAVSTIYADDKQSLEIQMQARLDNEQHLPVNPYWFGLVSSTTEQASEWITSQPEFLSLPYAIKELLVSNCLHARLLFDAGLTFNQCQTIPPARLVVLLRNSLDIKLISKNGNPPISFAPLIDIDITLLQEFINNSLIYMLIIHRYSIQLNELISLEKEHREVLAGYASSSSLPYLILKLPCSMIEFCKLAKPIRDAMEKESLYLMGLIDEFQLNPSRLLTLSAEDILELGCCYYNIAELVGLLQIPINALLDLSSEKRTFVLKDNSVYHLINYGMPCLKLFGLPLNEISELALNRSSVYIWYNELQMPVDIVDIPRENRLLFLQNGETVLDLVKDEKITEENLMELSLDELRTVLTHPESDESVEIIDRYTPRISFF
jgi:hypothetical protein